VTETPFVGPGEKPPPYRTALLLIDIQNDYFPGGGNELEGSLEAARCAARLLEHFRGAELPVFHARHVSIRPGATFFLPDTEGVRIHESVAPAAGEIVIEKHLPNAFAKTGLLTQLRLAFVSRLVVSGMMTHLCVDATVRAAFDYGFECIVAGDACATKALVHGGRTVSARDVHAAFLAALDGASAKVMSAEAVILLLAPTRS
jgi:nicotinamidase-related amidase